MKTFIFCLLFLGLAAFARENPRCTVIGTRTLKDGDLICEYRTFACTTYTVIRKDSAATHTLYVSVRSPFEKTEQKFQYGLGYTAEVDTTEIESPCYSAKQGKKKDTPDFDGNTGGIRISTMDCFPSDTAQWFCDFLRLQEYSNKDIGNIRIGLSFHWKNKDVRGKYEKEMWIRENESVEWRQGDSIRVAVKYLKNKR